MAIRRAELKEAKEAEKQAMAQRLQAGHIAKKAEREMEAEEPRLLGEEPISTLLPSKSAAAVKKWAKAAGGVFKELFKDVAVKKTKVVKAKKGENEGGMSEEEVQSPQKKATGCVKKAMKWFLSGIVFCSSSDFPPPCVLFYGILDSRCGVIWTYIKYF